MHPPEFVPSPPRPAPVSDTISLVIPVFNERESLSQLHAEIDAATAPLGRRVEILFIDDGSTDGSWDVIRELAARDPRVRGVRFRRNFGKAAALAAGFARAAGGVVLTLDADLQDDPKEIPRFLAAVKAGTDVVSGWKKERHDPWHKVFPSRVFNWMVSALTDVDLHDHNCGFKAYRADVVREVRLYGEFHRFVPVLAAAEGFSVGELVINHRPRKYGHSKFGARRFVKGALDLLTVRLLTAFGHRPKHALGTFGLVVGGLGLAGLAVFVALFARSAGGPSSPAVFGCHLFGLIASALAVVIGSQTFLSGLLAAFILARSAHHDPYRVAESIDPPPQ